MEKQGQPQKLLMIGLDGLMMELVRKFTGQGLMPNMVRFFHEGIVSKALPSTPVDTPTNWTTIATGADTGTHGKVGFYTKLSGQYIDEVHL